SAKRPDTRPVPAGCSSIRSNPGQSVRRIFSRESAPEKVSLQFQPARAPISLFSPGCCIQTPSTFSYDANAALEIDLARPVGGYPPFHRSAPSVLADGAADSHRCHLQFTCAYRRGGDRLAVGASVLIAGRRIPGETRAGF